MNDIEIEDFTDHCLFWVYTDRAHRWVQQNLNPPVWFGNAMLVDDREAAIRLSARLHGAGLSIQGKIA